MASVSRHVRRLPNKSILSQSHCYRSLYIQRRLLSAESASTGGSASYAGKIFGGSAVFFVLYLTRLRNPLYVSMIGSTETNLQLANGQSKKPLNSKWDSRSANDSMKTRLKSMEHYLGSALSAVPSDKIEETQQRADQIRNKGYSNAVEIGMERADFWAESGELVKFKQAIQLVNGYVTEGGTIETEKLSKLKQKAYGTKCLSLLGQAQEFSNQGDVSKCQQRISEIRSIQNGFDGVFVENDKLSSVLQKGHQQRIHHMLANAQKVRQNEGSRVQAKVLIEQAEQYAILHDVNFDRETAKQILK